MEFTHIDEHDNPGMVNVSHKKETARSARAQTEVWLPAEVRKHFKDGDIHCKKGAVFQTAIIAGTMALKQTSRLIPFCHQLNIEACDITITMVDECAVIECFAKTFGKTGVEMEALVGAQVAALTIYDMCKCFGHEMEIRRCFLVKKTGGKNDYSQ